LVNHEEKPIAFLSKSLSPVERRWSTIEKEQYAIFYALKQWEHLLKGRQFRLRTDHANLLKMNNNSPKVTRWKLALQEFNCIVEHVAGKDNIAADALSRLVESEPTSSTHPNDAEDTAMIAAIGFNAIRIPNDHYKTIASIHNSFNGHFGVEKTLQKLKTRGLSWPHMRAHVRLFVKECPCCQKMSQIKPVIQAKPFILSANAPMQRISIDSIGPINVNREQCEYRHILVFIDNFTRFVSLYPTKTVEAAEAAKALIDHIGRFGEPEQIQSDKGSEFINEVIEYLLKQLGIQHITGAPYSKEENAIVERANKEVMRHLRALVYHRNILSSWIDYLPLWQFVCF